MNERFFLMDCGEGTQIQLRRYKYSPVRINHIFISHLHGDHIFGLFGLISSMGMLGREAPLYIFGPSGLSELLKDHLKHFSELPFELHILPVKPGKPVYEDRRMTVTAIPLKHRKETFGYLFRENPRELNLIKEKIQEFELGVEEIKRVKQGEGVWRNGKMIPSSELTLPPWKVRSYAYLSDTAYDPSIVPLVKGVDLLFHEATFMEQDRALAKQTLHSTAKQAAQIARDAGVGKLLIGHFSTRYKDEGLLEQEASELFENTVAVNDGDRFQVALVREDGNPTKA